MTPSCVSNRSVRARNEAFLASCTAEEKAGIDCLYLQYADDLLDYLSRDCREILPELPERGDEVDIS